MRESIARHGGAIVVVMCLFVGTTTQIAHQADCLMIRMPHIRLRD